MRRPRIRGFVIPALAGLALGFAGVTVLKQSRHAPAVPPAATPAAPSSSVDSVIGAVGLVESASQEIAIGASASGTVAQLFVTPGQTVKAGEALFAQDSRSADAEVEARRQDLTAAEAKLAETLSLVPSLAAEAEAAAAFASAAEADLADAQDLERIGDRLAGSPAMAERETAHRRFAFRAAAARLAESRAKLTDAAAALARYQGKQPGEDGPVVASARASVAQAKALLGKAETERDLLTVRAPIDATVLQVNLRLGEYAQAGMMSSAMMVLGQTTPLHVRVEIDEADIPRFQPGAAAAASPRGDPGLRIPLRFVRIEPLVIPKKSLTGAGTERVDTRVLQVLYAFDPADLKVHPGMQLDVFIPAPAVAATERAGG